MARLLDDGTMDTVIVCEHCGEEARYSWQQVEIDTASDYPEVQQQNYDEFVKECIEDFDESHACPEQDDVDEDEVRWGSDGGK